MKTIIITILISSLVISCASVFCQQTGIQNKNLFGDVKSVKETEYSIPKHGINIGKETIISDIVTTYDIDGNKQKTSIYKNGELFTYTNYNYNSKNTITSSNEFNADGSPYLTITYSCNKDSTEIEAVYNRDVQKSYDDQRSSIDVEFESYYKKLFTRVLIKSDYKGNILEEKYFTQDSIQAYKFMYKYDYRYNRTEVKYYNSSGNVSWRKKIKYDSQGNIIEVKLFESNRIAMLSKFEYEYDENRNWIRREETKKLYDNFFSSNLNDNTIVTHREIAYY